MHQYLQSDISVIPDNDQPKSYYFTDQIVDLIPHTVLRLAIYEYRSAEEKLRKRFAPPLYTKAKLPHLAKKISDIITSEWEPLHRLQNDWKHAITTFNPHTFVTTCIELRMRFGTEAVERKVSETESKIRQAYNEVAAYIPLIMPEPNEFNGELRAIVSLMESYYALQFDEQFRNTKLQAKLLKVKTETTSTRTTQCALNTMYDNFRGYATTNVVHSINFDNEGKTNERDRKRNYGLVWEFFVKKLNKFGQEAFELVH